MKWEDLDYWNSGEWDVIQERLDDRRHAQIRVCPDRRALFRAMDITPFNQVRVAIIGQDPYPNPALATGVAFSIPDEQPFPPTLVNILTELQDDLGYPFPTSGNLEHWASQGVFLWNCIPTCDAGVSLSHAGWEEWSFLTQELVRKLASNSIVFAFCGNRARQFAQFADDQECDIFNVSHPSPRGARAGQHPFLGSRLFSSINGALTKQGLGHINWRLTHDEASSLLPPGEDRPVIVEVD